eukprot:jgi/Orpsp1_1/1174116/evm.model.c7180000048990.1
MIGDENNIPNGFVLLDENIPNGPITVDRELDDGTKRNLYSQVRSEDDSFYYKYEEYNNLEEIKSFEPEYLCEISSKVRPEAQKGYDISCPKYYTIKIEDAYYGRYANDTQHCPRNKEFTDKEMSKIKKNCGRNMKNKIKELCDGKVYCSIKPRKFFYGEPCK